MISRILGIGCLTSICLPTAWAADCPNRQPGQHLEFLGRSADNSVSLWLSSPGSGGNFRLSAPGVSEIDSWNANRASLHLSVSPVVLDDLNGTHKLDLLNADGSFNCFLDSRNQTNPVFPNIPPIDGETVTVALVEEPEVGMAAMVVVVVAPVVGVTRSAIL
ncbi:hypothetical protein [Aeromonas veronii]|uniref:hypothetical protein n=1 Tax=Aeromonas veronii TaxID=654 RepID=UPI0011193BFF|nr:hypothetical protein [Aeromonas veronii]